MGESEMSHLKVGDEVVLVGREYGPFRAGDLGTVVKLEPGMFPPDIYASVKKHDTGQIVHGFDWRWNKVIQLSEAIPMKEYAVTIVRSITESCIVNVTASSKGEAKEIAREEAGDAEWETDVYSCGDMEVTDIEEVT
jgi:hypothetical protein